MQRTEGSASVVTTGGAPGEGRHRPRPQQNTTCSRAGLCRVFGTRLKRTGRGRQVLADVRSLQSNASPDMKRRAFLRLVGVAASRQPMRRGVPRPRSLRRPASPDSSAGATASRRARQTRTTSCRGGPCPRIGSALPLRRARTRRRAWRTRRRCCNPCARPRLRGTPTARRERPCRIRAGAFGSMPGEGR